jgi:tetratricopeptide (TPR) repeat protein
MRRVLLIATLLAASASPSLSAQGRIRLPVGLGELEQRVRTDSSDAAAHYNVALGYWNARRYDEVQRELETALAIEPRFAPAHLALAYLPFARRPRLWDDIYKRNRPDSIVQLASQWRRHERAALLIDPLVNLAIIGATRPGKDVRWDMYEGGRGFYDIFFQGYDDIEQGRYDHAYYNFNRLLEMYREEVSRDPKRAPEEWLWWRALAASRVPEKFEIAIVDFQELLGRSVDRERSDTVYHVPLNTNEIRYFIATVHHRAGKNDEAVRLYREVLANDIGMYMANVKLADLFEGQRRYPEAIVERQNAISTNPDDPSLHLDLGITLGKAGEFEKAITELDVAAEGSPRDPRPAFWLGIAHLQVNNRDAARSHFTRFVQMAPSRMGQQVALARQRLVELQ